jgi:hypothetical protein
MSHASNADRADPIENAAQRLGEGGRCKIQVANWMYVCGAHHAGLGKSTMARDAMGPQPLAPVKQPTPARITPDAAGTAEIHQKRATESPLEQSFGYGPHHHKGNYVSKPKDEDTATLFGEATQFSIIPLPSAAGCGGGRGRSTKQHAWPYHVSSRWVGRPYAAAVKSLCVM